MNLIPLVSIRVVREGQSVTPEIGKSFDFTSGEKADLDAVKESHNVESYRLPVNEVPAEVAKVAAEEVKPLTAAEKKAAKLAAEAEAAAKLTGDEAL